ncbi:MAG: hypothetical protein L0332_35970, partial [Chloroflexi bacterium]|nr:hypothetical protein [Chloroflexota bacterium]MCI0732095.1 hypothetical protein [Chloroflexota bacterium]
PARLSPAERPRRLWFLMANSFAEFTLVLHLNGYGNSNEIVILDGFCEESLDTIQKFAEAMVAAVDAFLSSNANVK